MEADQAKDTRIEHLCGRIEMLAEVAARLSSAEDIRTLREPLVTLVQVLSFELKSSASPYSTD